MFSNDYYKGGGVDESRHVQTATDVVGRVPAQEALRPGRAGQSD